MACFTVAEVTLDDTADLRAARRALKLPETGPLSATDAVRVKTEAAVIKTMRVARQQAGRNARVYRDGNKVHITVTR